jgi:alpha-ribazole phosphatase
MRLYLIRHPQPDIAQGLCYGATDLRVSGDEVDRVLAGIHPLVPQHVPVFSSTLQRCTVLAEPLAQLCGSGAVHQDARLVEMHFGQWEMQRWEAIARTEIDAWADDLVDYRPGGGESVFQVAQRVTGFLHDLLQTGDDEAIIVCHAGTIRLLLAWSPTLSLREMARKAAVTPHQIAYGGVMIVDCGNSLPAD